MKNDQGHTPEFMASSIYKVENSRTSNKNDIRLSSISLDNKI
jgi:hypothetical protein